MQESIEIRIEQRQQLEVINWVAFGLHLVLALSAVVAYVDKGSVNVPVFWPKAVWNSTFCEASGYGGDVQICPSVEAAEHTGNVNFTLVLIASQSITCSAHLVQALQARRPSSVYIQYSLLRGIKIWHWCEYVFTAALLAHTILYFSGMLSIQIQLVGYAAQSTLMLVGLLQDTLRYACLQGLLEFEAVRGLVAFSFVIGFYNVCSVWAPSIYKLFIDNGDVDAPSFVKWIVFAEFSLYTSFGFAQLAFYTPFLLFGVEYTPRFYSEEVTLSLLSFLSKAVLATAFSTCLVYRQCGG